MYNSRVTRIALALVLTSSLAFAKKLPPKPAPKHPPRPAPKHVPKTAVEKLGAGYQQFLDGEYDAAKKTLASLDPASLRNGDYALYLLAQSELLSGDASAAAQHFTRVAQMDSRFRVTARFRAADALWEAGKVDEARRAYEVALPSANDTVEPAVALSRVGKLRKLWVEHPLHPLAADAEPKLQPPPSLLERVQRARNLTLNRAWPRALEELARVPADAPSAVRDEADYWIGMTHFKMRHGYDVAADKLLGVWARLPGDDRKADALFHGARAQSRVDRDDDAIKGYREVVAKFPHTKTAAEAQFLIGWLEFNRGKYKEALPGLEETLRKYGSSQWEDDARWYLGFSRWLAGDVAGALSDFDKLAAHSGALSGGKGAYWKGRALDKLGRADEAKAAWQKLVADFPFSYYSLSARARLAERGSKLGPFGDAGRGSAPPLQTIDPVVAQDPIVARADELLAAGLSVEAGVELRRGEPELMKKYGNARALPVLFDRYLRGENFQRPHQLAESFSGAALRLDPQADATVRAWWEEVYPRAYRAFIEKYSPTGENPPYYLYTIMQKESAYNPHDVSYADAIGLLQMIPPTSRRVAARIDYPYTDDVLYDPEGNIRFGAWYIGHLLKKFRGQIAIGAGSYNAGPAAMLKWLKKSGDRPLDEFIELCSYTQTREYMKKALDIYARYVYLYEKEDYLPDAQVNTQFLEDDGVDY
jgi:soluble lytic murein transglycosylase